MGAQNMPEAEVDVSVDLVRALLRDQHSDVADLPISELANGWDNVIFRLGTELTVRLPRRSMAAVLVEHEQRVLPDLASSLPIPIPAPIRVGRPALDYPWNWSINPWLSGSVAATTPMANPRREASRLGEFLAALHVPAPPDAPPNPYRGHFVADNTPIFTRRVERLRDTAGFHADRVMHRWHELIEVDRFGDVPRWIHGDLHALNVLVDDGAISAVIDFGDVCAGDPATDLSAAWSLFEPGVLELVRRSAGDVDDAMWQRAEAWALHFAVIYLVEAADNATMRELGRTMTNRLGVRSAMD